jgi:hypothetical protein
MLRVDFDNSSYGAQGADGIFSSSVGKWREKLSPTEAWWAQALAGRALSRLGYRREGVQPRLLHLARDAVSAPYALCRALRANRRKLGPLHRYLARRAAALFLE